MKKTALLSFLTVAIFILSGCVTLVKSKKDETYHRFPKKAFVQLKYDITNPLCEDGKTKEGKKCENRVDLMYGSGAVIEQQKDGAVILTAAHVCKKPMSVRLALIMLKYDLSMSDLKAQSVDYYGKEYPTSIMRFDNKKDLCLMKAKGLKAEQTVKVSDKMPEEQNMYYNMAAPHGFYDEGMVLTYSGVYSGQKESEKLETRFDVYTVPVAPGSSGSPIMNKNMEIVGVVSRGYMSSVHIALSPTFNDLKNFMHDN